MILLPLRSTSNKPWQKAIPKDHQTKPSRTARKAVSQPTFIGQPTWQASACRTTTKALCAVQSTPWRLRAAFLNCWGSCTPLAYFFLLLKKSRSPHAVGTGVANASKATNVEAEPNALSKSVPHSSLMGGRIRTNKNQIGIRNPLIIEIPLQGGFVCPRYLHLLVFCSF